MLCNSDSILNRVFRNWIEIMSNKEECTKPPAEAVAVASVLVLRPGEGGKDGESEWFPATSTEGDVGTEEGEKRNMKKLILMKMLVRRSDSLTGRPRR